MLYIQLRESGSGLFMFLNAESSFGNVAKRKSSVDGGMGVNMHTWKWEPILWVYCSPFTGMHT